MNVELASAQGVRFTFGKWNTRKQRINSRLHRDDVRDIRRWAQREGFGLSVRAQVRWLQKYWYPTMSKASLREVLTNVSWTDLTYTHDTPDATWWSRSVSPALCLLFMLRCLKK